MNIFKDGINNIIMEIYLFIADAQNICSIMKLLKTDFTKYLLTNIIIYNFKSYSATV